MASGLFRSKDVDRGPNHKPTPTESLQMTHEGSIRYRTTESCYPSAFTVQKILFSLGGEVGLAHPDQKQDMLVLGGGETPSWISGNRFYLFALETPLSLQIPVPHVRPST